MIVAVALYFGGNYGQASWESIARARCFLARWMYKHTKHQEELNNNAHDLFHLLDEDDLSELCTVRPDLNDFKNPLYTRKVPSFQSFGCLSMTDSVQSPVKKSIHIIL